MKKITVVLFICMSLFSILKAENIEFEGCNDINHNISSKKSEQIKSMITNNIKSKEEFLKSLGFNINSVLDYKEVCKRLVIIVKNEQDKEHSFTFMNYLIEQSILKDNNIDFNEYSLKLNNKISEKK